VWAFTAAMSSAHQRPLGGLPAQFATRELSFVCDALNPDFDHENVGRCTVVLVMASSRWTSDWRVVVP
jgi:hypothetical protein